MAPLIIRFIVINIVLAAVARRFFCFSFFVLIIAIFFSINITFCSIICIGGKCIVITIINLATDNLLFCIVGINICIIYIILG